MPNAFGVASGDDGPASEALQESLDRAAERERSTDPLHKMDHQTVPQHPLFRSLPKDATAFPMDSAYNPYWHSLLKEPYLDPVTESGKWLDPDRHEPGYASSKASTRSARLKDIPSKSQQAEIEHRVVSAVAIPMFEGLGVPVPDPVATSRDPSAPRHRTPAQPGAPRDSERSSLVDTQKALNLSYKAPTLSSLSTCHRSIGSATQAAENTIRFLVNDAPRQNDDIYSQAVTAGYETDIAEKCQSVQLDATLLIETVVGLKLAVNAHIISMLGWNVTESTQKEHAVESRTFYTTGEDAADKTLKKQASDLGMSAKKKTPASVSPRVSGLPSGAQNKARKSFEKQETSRAPSSTTAATRSVASSAGAAVASSSATSSGSADSVATDSKGATATTGRGLGGRSSASGRGDSGRGRGGRGGRSTKG